MTEIDCDRPSDELRQRTSSTTRFVLLGARRSGSTVVGSALADHPDILYYGELFHGKLDRRMNEAARRTFGHALVVNLPDGFPVCADDDGFQYLEGFFDRPSEDRIIGFKMLYHQAREGAISTAWQFLAQRRDISIIHLYRENWLEILVSTERVKVTGIWNSKTPLDPQPLRLIPEKCLAYFKDHEKNLEMARALFAKHKVMTLNYTEIRRSFKDSINRIYAFLRLDSQQTCEPKLCKLVTAPLSAQLINFSELRDFFLNTEYIRFFDES